MIHIKLKMLSFNCLNYKLDIQDLKIDHSLFSLTEFPQNPTLLSFIPLTYCSQTFRDFNQFKVGIAIMGVVIQYTVHRLLQPRVVCLYVTYQRIC